MSLIADRRRLRRCVAFATCLLHFSGGADFLVSQNRSHTIQSLETGYFVSVEESGLEGSKVLQLVFPQTYTFVEKPSGSYAIRRDVSGKYINVDIGDPAKRRVFEGDFAQEFHIELFGSVAGEPIVALQSMETGLYVNVDIGQARNGGDVYMLDYPQRFILGDGVPTSPKYTVKFDGKEKKVFFWSHEPHGPGSDSWASVTLTANSVNASIQARTSRSGEVNIRPKHFVDWGWVTDVQAYSGHVTFKVTRPCQLSIEFGHEHDIMGTRSSYDSFDTRLLFVNPAENTWSGAVGAVAKPTADTCSGRCVLGSKLLNDGCQVSYVHGDVYFDDSIPFYIWSADGCRSNGVSMKTLHVSGNVFIDDGVVVYARITSSESGSGVYGYGMVSNFYQMGEKNGEQWSNNIDLDGYNSTIFGVISVASTYRNLHVGKYSQVRFTKSMASPYISETDCVNTEGYALVANNFFKTNDDCIKVYKSYTMYKNNVMWHQYVGGGIMISWGNQNENTENVTDVLVEDTHVIHDGLSYSVQQPEDFSKLLSSMHYYSFLIRMFHANRNLVGFPQPTTIKNLYLESGVGSIFGLFNGFKGDGWAEWMDGEGPSGNVSLSIVGLNMTYVTWVAAPAVIGGCRPGEKAMLTQPCICAGNPTPPYNCGIDLNIQGELQSLELVTGSQIHIRSSHNTGLRHFSAVAADRGKAISHMPANILNSNVFMIFCTSLLLGAGASALAFFRGRQQLSSCEQPLVGAQLPANSPSSEPRGCQTTC